MYGFFYLELLIYMYNYSHFFVNLVFEYNLCIQ